MINICEIYDEFLRKIKDYKILKMTDEDIKDVLLGYYKSAVATFYKCKKDLSTEVTNGETYIKSNITDFEKKIIISLMLIEHITPRLISDEKMEQTLNDKDFKIYSQANQLREVRLLLEGMESKSEKLITKYTFFYIDGKKEND